MENLNPARRLERQHLLNFAITSASLGAHFVSLLVAKMSQAQDEGKANWNDAETLALVNYLWEHRAEAGDGGTFKDATFNAAAAHIAREWTTGAVKTAKRCKTKWAGVSPYYLTPAKLMSSPSAQDHFSSGDYI